MDGDFLACGSETADLYCYYKALSKPVAQQAFATATGAGERDGGGPLEVQVGRCRGGAVVGEISRVVGLGQRR